MKLRLCTAALVATLLMPTATLADGLPVLNVDVGSSGVTAQGLNARYVTVLQPRKTLTLRGDFSFDALAPDGRWI